MASTRNTIPRYRSLHPLGHLPALRRDFPAFQRAVAAAGDVVRVRLGFVDSIWVSSPASLHEVLQGRAEDYEKSAALTSVLRPILGDGILSSQGSRHRKRRALVAPAFSAGRIARYAEAMVSETDRVLDEIEQQTQVDLSQEMMRLTLEIVANTLICSRVEGDVRTVDRCVTAVSEATGDLLRLPVPLPPTRLTAAGRRIERARRDLDRVVYRVIAERRRSGEDPGDVLSMLLASQDAETGEGLSDEELRDEVMTLMLAGHETTANALTWCLQLLATHPEITRCLQRELDEALQGRPPRHTDLPQLPYTQCVFKEAMRLYPPAFATGRAALIESRIGPYRIEAGEVVFANILGVHQREDLFPDARAFRPERFADQAEKSWPRAAYLPFSVGPRVCVGNHFALMEGQLVLARIAQRLELVGSIDALAPTEPLVTLRPKGPVHMRVQRRPTAAPLQPGSASQMTDSSAAASMASRIASESASADS